MLTVSQKQFGCFVTERNRPLYRAICRIDELRLSKGMPIPSALTFAEIVTIPTKGVVIYDPDLSSQLLVFDHTIEVRENSSKQN